METLHFETKMQKESSLMTNHGRKFPLKFMFEFRFSFGQSGARAHFNRLIDYKAASSQKRFVTITDRKVLESSLGRRKSSILWQNACLALIGHTINRPIIPLHRASKEIAAMLTSQSCIAAYRSKDLSWVMERWLSFQQKQFYNNYYFFFLQKGGLYAITFVK